MSKENKTPTTNQANQDFTPDQNRMYILVELQKFCETEIEIDNKVLEMIQNPNIESWSQTFLNDKKKLEQTIQKNQELKDQRTQEITLAQLTLQNLQTVESKQQDQQLINEQNNIINQKTNEINSISSTIKQEQQKLQDLTQKEATRKKNQEEWIRKGWKEALKNPQHPWTAHAQDILKRQQMAKAALGFINQAIEKEQKYYSVERRGLTTNVFDNINNNHVVYYDGGYWTIQGRQKLSHHATDFNSLINYADNQDIHKLFKIFMRDCEKLPKARNDDERYQPLKDIMDGMIIMLAKASSMFMPPALIDITIKALEMIGGHLADIIKEDFEKISKQPNNSVELAELAKKKEELEISISNSRKATTSSQIILGFELTETAKKLGVAVDSQKQISEELINSLEERVKNIQNDQTKTPSNTPPQLSPEEIKLVTENIKLYKNAKTTLDNMQKHQAELNNVNPSVEQPKKETERKSIKEMIKETKIKRDATYQEKVRKEQKDYENQFKTR